MEEQPRLVKKPGSNSVLWNYFGLEIKNGKVIDDGNGGIC